VVKRGAADHSFVIWFFLKIYGYRTVAIGEPLTPQPIVDPPLALRQAGDFLLRPLAKSILYGIVSHLKRACGMEMPQTGRPTKYRAEIGEQIADAMAEGLSLEAAAAACGVSPRVVFNWQRRHPAFLQAVERGRAQSLLFWERRAIALAAGAGGNANIVSLGLKNRSRAASGWHDSQRLEHSGPDGSPIPVVATTIDVGKLSKDDRNALKRVLLTVSGKGAEA
jgi:hypothetical protein